MTERKKYIHTNFAINLTVASLSLAIATPPVVEIGTNSIESVLPKNASSQEIENVRRAFDRSQPLLITQSPQELPQLQGRYSKALPDGYPLAHREEITPDKPSTPTETVVYATRTPKKSYIHGCEVFIRGQVPGQKVKAIQAIVVNGKATAYISKDEQSSIRICASTKRGEVVLTRGILK